MSPEIIGLLSVNVALSLGLGGLTLALWRSVRADVHKLADRVDGLSEHVHDLAQRVARIEGVIDGVIGSRTQGTP